MELSLTYEEVMHMNVCSNHVPAWIANVEEITLSPMQSDDSVPVYQQSITVRTAKGETFEILLQAPKKQNLKFRKAPKSDWLDPLIYIPDEDPPY
jgi:hypothetical protein